MNPIPSRCPLCGGELVVTRIYCRDCDTTLEGRFTSGPFSQLTPEQINFIITFVRCEGKITRMEDEIGLSYPTIRNRLHEVIRALGYEPGSGEESLVLTEQERQKILEDLDAGRISAEQAMQMLREAEE
ncbi:MAG: DUF2089 domain-containing protein [Anaerolineales bacterium]|jgi:hypothetical protein|nr:DUF2089 domain-containing protein [Anaerolineales bacterium]